MSILKSFFALTVVTASFVLGATCSATCITYSEALAALPERAQKSEFKSIRELPGENLGGQCAVVFVVADRMSSKHQTLNACAVTGREYLMSRTSGSSITSEELSPFVALGEAGARCSTEAFPEKYAFASTSVSIGEIADVMEAVHRIKRAPEKFGVKRGAFGDARLSQVIEALSGRRPWFALMCFPDSAKCIGIEFRLDDLKEPNDVRIRDVLH